MFFMAVALNFLTISYVIQCSCWDGSACDMLPGGQGNKCRVRTQECNEENREEETDGEQGEKGGERD